MDSTLTLPRERPSPLATLLWAAVLAALVALLFRPQPQQEATGSLHYPAQSGARLVERHLAFYDGFEEAPSWQRWFFDLLFDGRDAVVTQAVATYQDILRFFTRHPERAGPWDVRNTRLRLLVLYGETGRWREFERELAALGDMPEEAVLAETLRFAYDLPLEDEVYVPELHAGLRMFPGGWARDHMRLRVYRRLGLDEQHGAEAWLAARGRELRRETLVTAFIVGLGLVAGAGCALAGCVRRNRPWRAQALETPWSLGEGLGVLVRAAVLGLLVLAGVHWLAPLVAMPLLAHWSTLLAALPMLWLIRRRLLAPRGLGFVEAFGLRIDRQTLLPLVAATLAVFTVERAGALGISWLAWSAGFEPHWSEGLAERWLWSPWSSTLASGIDVVVWAPIVEEIGFRGLLYLTLRSRLKPLPAALISAGAFSLLHLYSVSGFLSVFWSGLVWAWAFERFRSLLPGMLTHALGNLLAVSMVLVFYR